MSNFCKHCGYSLLPTDKFCPGCGADLSGDTAATAEAMSYDNNYETAETEVLQTPPPTGQYYVPQPDYTATQSVPLTSRKISAGRIIGSIFMTIFVFVLGSYGIFGLLVRLGTSSNKIADVVTNSISNVTIQFDNADSEELAPYLAEVITEYTDVDVSEEDISKILEKGYIKEFITNKSQDYIDDILHNTGDGKITDKEIEDILDNVYNDLSEDYNIKKSEFDDVKSRLIDSVDFDTLDIDTYRDSASILINAIGIAFSYPVIFACLGIAFILYILLIVVNKSGIVSGVVGIVMSVPVIATGVVGLLAPKVFNRIYELGIDFYKSLFSSLSLTALAIGGGLLLVSILSLILTGVFKKKARSNN